MTQRYIPLRSESQQTQHDVLYFDSHAPFESIKNCAIARQTIACSLVSTINDLDRTSETFDASLKKTNDAVILLLNDVMSMIPCLLSKP